MELYYVTVSEWEGEYYTTTTEIFVSYGAKVDTYVIENAETEDHPLTLTKEKVWGLRMSDEMKVTITMLKATAG